MNIEEFESTLIEMFPVVATTGTATRKQISDTMERLGTTKWPNWIMKNAVDRGVYSLKPVIKPAAAQKAEVHIHHELTSPDGLSVQIPTRDKNYVQFGNHRDVDRIVKSGMFYPTYITGPTGNGKSTMVEQVCATNNRSMIRINLNLMTDEEQLIGSKTLVDGNVEIVEGPVLMAMRSGAILLLDELDAGGCNALLALQGILEGKPFYFKLKNEVITPAPGFNIFATANTKGKGSDDGRYIGTNILNEAFLERFAVTFNQEYPSASVERKIIMNLMESYGIADEDFADTLVKWADAIRRTFEDGGIDELITTRRLVHIVRAYSIFQNKKKAIELCCNRFDDITRLAFIDLFDKISTEPVQQSEVVVQSNTDHPF